LESITSSGLRASTIGTRSTISNWSMHTTIDRITRVRGTSIEIIAINGSKGAANLRIASIHGTVTIVVTNHSLKDASSIERVTYVVIAFIGRRRTSLGFINTSSSCSIA